MKTRAYAPRRTPVLLFGQLFILLVSLLLVAAPCFAATHVLIVATQSWQSTGAQVKQGTAYGVWQTQGQWTVDYRIFQDVDGAGYSLVNDPKIYQGCKHKSTWPYGLLLGKIGNTIFPIGRVKSFTAPQNGILELGIHDRCLTDNGGYLAVTVEEGLSAVGVLQRFTESLVRDLTPPERNRLLEVESNISACDVAQPNTLAMGCMKVLEGVLSIHFPQSPE
jgi:hypothetical protein